MIDFTSISLEKNLQMTTEFNQPTMKEIFKGKEISICSCLNRSHDNANVDGSFYVSNNTSYKLSNVKLNFSVKNTLIFKVLSTSGNVLEPNSSLGIKKVK